jgi:general stress protein CsbA
MKKVIALTALVLMLSLNTYASTTSNMDSSNGMVTLAEVSLLIGAIILPAFGRTKA